MNHLSTLQPQQLWENFAQICQIPHPSKKEVKLVSFIKKFGETLNLETIVDEVGNILIKKPATIGRENHKVVVLQAHLDMVPQKNTDVVHDFATDPIQAYVDGEWVTAKGTSLGADNGIGVAAIMAVLQAQDIEHGLIEALFTIDEEEGMTGALALKPGILKGEILLNLDTELDSELFIGCAGGVLTDVKLSYSEVPTPKNIIAFKINISGLKGGHSGMDIIWGRGNANKILNRLLWQVNKDFELSLAEFISDFPHNAIPREASALVVVPQGEKDDFVAFIKQFADIIKQELSFADPDVKIEALKKDPPSSIMNKEIQNNLLNALYACPSGVLKMSADMPNLVEVSTNLAAINLEKGIINIVISHRSSVDSLKDEAANIVECVFKLIGAEVKHHGSYPGWKTDPDSFIVNLMKNIYKEKYGIFPEVKAIHAGLECGILKHLYPDMEMISFGPTIENVHSPDERVNIVSVAKFWDLLVETLKKI